MLTALAPRNTALNDSAVKTSPTKKPSKSSSVTSYFSQITGPFIQAWSSTWSQVILPVTVGTVMIIVNEATNKTSTTTIYHTEFEKNGSATLLTRTDTNAAGTITQVVTDEHNELMTM